MPEDPPKPDRHKFVVTFFGRICDHCGFVADFQCDDDGGFPTCDEWTIQNVHDS